MDDGRSITMQARCEDGRVVQLDEDGTWRHVDAAEVLVGTTRDGFRRTRWGQSQADTLATEEEKPPALHRDDLIGYSATLATLDCLALFSYVDDRLVTGRYEITEKHSNPHAYLSDYAVLETLLTRKYGTSTAARDSWTDGPRGDDQSQREAAVSSGHYARSSQWSASETDIKLTVSGENHKVRLTVEYTPKTFERSAETRDAQRYMEDL